jgi:hypothetical protein
MDTCLPIAERETKHAAPQRQGTQESLAFTGWKSIVA